MIRNIVNDPVMRRLAVLFLITRLALLAAGLAGHALLPSGKALTGENLRLEHGVPLALDIWARWDSEWYLLIADRGYDATDAFNHMPGGYLPEDTAGFFPLYPLLIRALTPLVGAVGAGIVISNIALLVSLWLLTAVTRNLWGESFGSKAGLGAGTALLFFPFALFHSAVYSESLFLALSLATFLLARKNRYDLAGLLAALATLTRPFGALLVILLLLEWWRQRHRSRWGWAAAGSVALALGLYMLFCYGLFGDALAFVHRQGRWRGNMGLPGFAFVRWWQAGPTIHGAHGSVIELVMAILFLGALPTAFRRLRPSLAWYLAACVAVPLCSTLWSFGRIASSFFPIYLLAGMVWAEERPALQRIWVTIGGAGAALAMAYFAAGWWVG
ncbi:MAG: hypothetical protein KAJ78_02265 [Acidobacteria bacterium]|nr:hypothetical protein [Acidobacteriota bacterium]